MWGSGQHPESLAVLFAQLRCATSCHVLWATAHDL